MGKRSVYLLIIAIAFCLTACANPAADKTKAMVLETDPILITGNGGVGETLRITPENSKIDFIGSKVTGSQAGRFEDFSGAIELVDNRPEKSRVRVEIKMGSVKTDSKGLDEHLKTSDFFDAAKFPNAIFISTEISNLKNNEKATHELKGKFELHGVTKTISFPTNLNIDEDSVTVNSEFSINRKDFDITYAGRADDLIREEVVIKLSIHIPRSKTRRNNHP